MPRQADRSWDGFRKALRDVAPKQLAEAMKDPDITHFTTSNWKQGKARPSLEFLPRISEALGEDPTFLAQEMGIIPKMSEAAERIVYMHRRIGDLETRLDEFDQRVANRRDKAVGKIVAEAAHTGKWAVAVWPALEGPEDFKFHVSDRLDFTRVDGGAVSHETLRQEEKLADLLAKAHAVFSPDVHPRWAEKEPRETGSSDRTPILRLSIPRLTSMFTPGTTTPIRKQGSVAVVALTVQSWAMDTAGFLARMLNYGFMSSRALVTETHGYRMLPISDTERGLRNDLHASMVTHPETRYVWGHYNLEDTDPEVLFPNRAHWPDTLTWVWVYETDDLLKNVFPDNPELVTRCKKARDATQRYVDGLNSRRIIRVDADYPRNPDGTPVPKDSSRDWRMEQALSNAATAVEEMINRKIVDRHTIESTVALMKKAEQPDEPPTRPSRSPIAHTTYRWLADKKRLGARQQLEVAGYATSPHSSSSRMREA